MADTLTKEKSEQRMREAAEDGLVDIVKSCLSAGVGVNSADSLDFRTALHLASENGHLKIVELLIGAGADLELVNTFGNTALHWGVGESHLEVVKVLLEAGARTDVANMYTEMTPLHWAAGNGDLGIVQLLLNHGANMEALTAVGYTPLHEAALNGSTSVAKCLLYNGADRTVKGKDNKVPRDLALRMEAHTVVAVIDNVAQHLRKAADEGKMETCLHLLATTGADVNDQCEDTGVVALQLAAKNGHTQIVRALLDHGADPNIQAMDMNTALHLACAQGFEETTTPILSCGRADLEIKDKNGETALLIAAKVNSLPLVNDLLERGASASASNLKSETPLQFVAKHGNNAAVTLLLRAGAPVDFRDDNQKTPLLVAAEHGHALVINRLLETGAHVEARDADKNTPLHLACKFGHQTAVLALLNGGGSVTAKGESGRTAKMHASNYQHKAVERMLDSWIDRLEGKL